MEVKFHVVSHHFPDDSDELAGTVPEGIIVSPTFSHLGFVVSLESGIIFNNIVSCINKCISEDFGSTFGHSGPLSLKVSRLIDRRIQTSICKQLVGAGETMYITDFTKYHSSIDISDTRNGHNDRIIAL